MTQPIIGITCDTVAGATGEKWKYESPYQYARCVAQAGGIPFLLPYEAGCIGDYLRLCQGFLLSGGDDPDVTRYGDRLHPKANVMHPQRQAFESGLLAALDATSHPALGVCLGMQLMALHAGGRMHQHLPDAPGFDEGRAGSHRDAPHAISLITGDQPYLPRAGQVHSKHHQAVADPGRLRAIAAHDGVIEAIDDPANPRRFYVGVQWHPECTADEELGIGLIRRFVEACRK